MGKIHILGLTEDAEDAIVWVILVETRQVVAVQRDDLITRLKMGLADFLGLAFSSGSFEERTTRSPCNLVGEMV